jgi:hypothetical protein
MKNKANMKPILTYVSREEAKEASRNMSRILAYMRLDIPRFKRYKEEDIITVII